MDMASKLYTFTFTLQAASLRFNFTSKEKNISQRGLRCPMPASRRSDRAVHFASATEQNGESEPACALSSLWPSRVQCCDTSNAYAHACR